MTKQKQTRTGFLAATLFAAAAFAATPAPAQAAEYKIDKAHSFIQFRTKHLGMSWLVGRFDQFDGVFHYDPAAGAGAQSVAVTVQIASVNSNHAERDKHLRDDDFLDADAFGEAVFESTEFVGDENGGVMRGVLTLHGQSAPMEIAVKKIGEGKDPWGGYRAGFEGAATIDRRNFGIDRNLGPESWEVELMLYLEGVRK